MVGVLWFRGGWAFLLGFFFFLGELCEVLTPQPPPPGCLGGLFGLFVFSSSGGSAGFFAVWWGFSSGGFVVFCSGMACVCGGFATAAQG